MKIIKMRYSIEPRDRISVRDKDFYLLLKIWAKFKQ